MCAETPLNPTSRQEPDSSDDSTQSASGERLYPQVAVVGCGRWGRNLVRNFNNLEHLYAVCDQMKEQLQDLRAQYPAVMTTSDYSKLLSNPKIDAVVIATPSRTHHALAKAALEAGKHVYVEKPMATSSEQTQELFKLAQELDQVLMVGHLLLYHPAVNRLRQLIREGYLGEVRYIQSDRLNFNPFRQDKSVIWDLAPHDLSMMCFLLDREPEGIVSVNGHRTSDADGLVDVAHIELAFPGGVAGHIHNSWIDPQKQVKLIVRGTKRTAILDDTLGEGKLQIFTKEDETQPLKEFPEYLRLEPLKLECQHFINAVKSGTSPKTDGYNGYHVVKILELADKMLEEQHAVSSS